MNIHVHHIDYRRVGNERFGDLVVICSGCHDELHRWIDAKIKPWRTRRRVMDKLRPVMLRRLLAIHDAHRGLREAYEQARYD